MVQINSAIIVGGGIAGLCSAIALARIGARCTLVEQTSELAGTAIAIQPNGQHALGELGVLQACEAAGHYLSVGAPTAPPISLAFYRPSLMQTLRKAARDAGVNIRLGSAVRSVTQNPSSVTATLSDGDQLVADLLVGADGINSTVRSAVFGDGVAPQYTGQFHIRWLSSGPPIPSRPGMVSAPWGKILSYPLPKDGKTYLITIVNQPAWRRIDDAEASAMFPELMKSFDHPYIHELMHRFESQTSVRARPFEWLFMPAPWHKGRVIIIGDAAHATTSHMSSGGGMAIEDTVVLGQELQRASTIESGFSAFMARRFERVKLVVDTSLALSKAESEGVPLSKLYADAAPAFAALNQPY